MMKLEIYEEFPLSDDQTIVKRKRTKRPRKSSSASSSGGAAIAGNYSTTSSGISTSTEEDEDMANCLILLARGNSPPPAAAANKLSSRKFTEMAITAAGKVGIYVYECKTCNRTFPSFQALGGHRASHKRPKLAADIDRKIPPAADNQEKDEKRIITPANSKLIHPTKIICHINEQNKLKTHECSICGSEFASGQALGGHMRRHRAAPPPIASTRISEIIDDVREKPRSMLALDLDLNLPAAEEDDKFNQFPGKQQPSIVFSAAALVDCHY